MQVTELSYGIKQLKLSRWALALFPTRNFLEFPSWGISWCLSNLSSNLSSWRSLNNLFLWSALPSHREKKKKKDISWLNLLCLCLSPFLLYHFQRTCPFSFIEGTFPVSRLLLGPLRACGVQEAPKFVVKWKAEEQNSLAAAGPPARCPNYPILLKT